MASESQRAPESSRTAPCREYGHTGYRRRHLDVIVRLHDTAKTPEVPTVYALANLDDLAERHRFPVLRSEVRKDTRPKGDLLVEVALREAIAAELELGGMYRVQVGVEDTERIEVGNVVAAYLVGAD